MCHNAFSFIFFVYNITLVARFHAVPGNCQQCTNCTKAAAVVVVGGGGADAAAPVCCFL